MGRRGFRGSRNRGNGGRLLDRVRDLKTLGLRDLRGLERPTGSSDDVEIGRALRGGDQLTAIVASRRGGSDLVGWGLVASALIERDFAPSSVLIAAPIVSARLRRSATAAVERGWAASVSLVCAPVLAEAGEAPIEEEVHLRDAARGAWAPSSGQLIHRLARVAEGAATMTAAGAVRRTDRGFILYIRGVQVLELRPQGDGVALEFMRPERRRLEVTELSFPRWGPELHEAVTQLAADPRLVDRDLAARERAIEAAAEAARARVTARWLPWNDAGSEPVDWLGVDDSGRPVLGVVRRRVGVADVPGILAALDVLEEEAEEWAPGASGRPRLALGGDTVDPSARDLLSIAGVEFESASIPESEAGAESDRPQRRRGRRRHRGRGDDAEQASAAAPVTESRREEGRAAPTHRERARPESSRRPRHEREPERTRTVDEDSPDQAASRADEAAEPRRDERPKQSPQEEISADADLRQAEASAESASESDAGPDRAEPSGPAEPQPAPTGEADNGGGLEREIEAALAEDEGEAAEADQAAEGQPLDRDPPRRRRARAAIAVRRDPDAILAALVLARERRNIPFLWICSQDELMDFFRGKATDLDENADLCLVGFTAQPVPKEVIGAAELYRSRLEWFDDHDWPIEDLEALREAIGRDSIFIAEGASSPLAAIMGVSERRSRFTDKLVDLSGRRLSEHDMQKWGYRLVGLLRRLTQRGGECRAEIQPILAGKPTELPEAPDVYASEEAWIEAHDPRIVHFGEYQMAVLQVPEDLDSGEVGRRVRLRAGTRLSLASRTSDPVVVLGCNEEKRHINVLGMVGHLDSHVAWAHAKPGGDRAGRFEVDELSTHPERIEALIGEIVRNKSILYG